MIKQQYSDKFEYDKFYTKPDIAKLCLNEIDFEEYDFVIEPSAGNGNFLNNISHHNKIGIDIKPEHEFILNINWFDYSIDTHFNNVIVIGNPPFGKRNNLSIKFIQHAMSFKNVKTIAFILPNVFKKHTLQKNISKEYRLKSITVLPKDSFLVYGKTYNIPCSFFVFDKSNGIDLRFKPDNFKETNDFVYGTKENYDFFVMGAAPNIIKEKPSTTNRGYYIKVKEGIDINTIKNNFINGKWKGQSSANGGVYWLTKPELIENYLMQYSGK